MSLERVLQLDGCVLPDHTLVLHILRLGKVAVAHELWRSTADAIHSHMVAGSDRAAGAAT